MFETIQGMTMIIFGLFLILILLFVLRIVHAQAAKVRELEAQMKMTEDMSAPEPDNVTYKEN